MKEADKMNKLKGILLITLLFCIFSCNSAMASDWKIEVNGEPIDAEVKIIDGRSLIPLRTVSEAMGLDVEYHADGNWVNISAGEIARGGRIIFHDTDGSTVDKTWYYDRIAIFLGSGQYQAKICNESIDAQATSAHRGYFTISGRVISDYSQDASKKSAKYDEKYKVYTSSIDNLPYYAQVKPVNLNGTVYVPVRLICDSFGAPVTVENNTISIGSCFTAEDKSIDKILKLVYAVDTGSSPQIEAENSSSITTANDSIKTSVIKHCTEAMESMSKSGGYIGESLNQHSVSSAVHKVIYAQHRILDAKSRLDVAMTCCSDYSDMQTVKSILKRWYDKLNMIPTEINATNDNYLDISSQILMTLDEIGKSSIFDDLDTEFRKWD